MRASGVRRPLREFRIAGSPLKQRDKRDFPARPHCERARKRRQEGAIGPARRATPTAPATFRPPTFGTFRPSQESAKRTSDPRAGIRLRISPHDSGNVFSGEKERRIVMPGATKRCTAIDRSAPHDRTVQVQPSPELAEDAALCISPPRRNPSERNAARNLTKTLRPAFRSPARAEHSPRLSENVAFHSSFSRKNH